MNLEDLLTLSFSPTGWTTSMASFHLTLRLNLLIPTPSTWVSTVNAINNNTCELCSGWFMDLLYCSDSVNLLSLELTFFCSGLLFAAVVRRRVWDYALTVTLLHVGITSLGESTSDGLHPSPRPTWNLEWVLFLCYSNDGVSHGVAVVAGLR